MKRSGFLFALSTVLCGTLVAQESAYTSQAEVYASTITPVEIKANVDFLASDELEGRLTGARGQKVAAQFIATRFASYGLEPGVPEDEGKQSYFQKITLQKNRTLSAYIETATGRQTLSDHHIALVRNANSGVPRTKTTVLAIDENFDFEKKGAQLSGKTILIIADGWRSYSAVYAKTQKYNAKAISLFGYVDEEDTENLLKRFSQRSPEESDKISLPPSENTSEKSCKFFVDHTVIGDVFEKPYSEVLKAIEKGSIPKASISVFVDQESTSFVSENVVGVIPGTDKKDEYIFITSHYDHEGIKNGKIYNGADDNASGTSAVLEIAEAFAHAASNGNAPRRTLVFMTVTGEEKGLLGSEYYSENPIFPLKNTVADFNIDMVGRLDEKHPKNQNYIYLIGSDRLSQDLHNISESVNQKHTQIELDYTFNAKDDPNRFYYRSDHYNFAKKNIPIIFYFNGVHEDYHQATDTPDKILHGKIAKISTLIFHTIWEVANRDERIRLNGTDVKK